MEMRRGNVLAEGDVVALVSPSGPAPRERVERGVAIIESWGLKARVGLNAYERAGYFGGDDATRLADLNAALCDPDVRGIICTRGGYGAQRIVDGVDFAAARRDPKVLAGFSDVTALHMALYSRIGLAGLQSPMAAWNAERTGDVSADSLRDALMTREPVVIRPRADVESVDVVIDGPAVTGTLLGGNLALITTTVGTGDMPDLSGAILFLEDVNEPPYKVDRMLTHLRRAGVLDGLAGVALGQFTECADGWPVTVADVLRERLGDLGIPVLGGLPSGHGVDQMAVPVGVPATLDVRSATLTAEPAVR